VQINDSQDIAFDAQSLAHLKRSQNAESPEAIKEVAKQFEALFMNMMLKSMRAATPQESPFENQQTRTFTAMLDQQLSSDLAKRGLGLSDILAKQLSKGMNPVDDSLQQAVESPNQPEKKTKALDANNLLHTKALQAYTSNDLVNAQNKVLSDIATNQGIGKIGSIHSALIDTALKQAETDTGSAQPLVGVKAFQTEMKTFADQASQTSGIPSHLMLGQAALESGWGKRQIKGANGEESYNLFGIKAGKGWNGKVVDTLTTEYINGIKQKKVEQFRAYDNYAESFKDFANLLQNNPRYQAVLANTDNTKRYATALQDAGYATDPNYAKKLINVIGMVANP